MNNDLKRVWLLSDPFESLAIRLFLIRNAKKSICIQTFIWGSDDLSFFLLEELLNASNRGVEIQLLLDGWVGVDHPELILALKNASKAIKSKHYNPPTRVVWPSVVRLIRAISVNAKRLNHRMHSKIFSVDSKWTILGGRNYEAPYFGVHEDKFFRDREILIYQKNSIDIEEAFTQFWNHSLSIPTENLSFTYFKNEKRKSFLMKHTKIGLDNELKLTEESNLLKSFNAWFNTFSGFKWLSHKKFHPLSIKLLYDVPGDFKGNESNSAKEMLKAISTVEQELVLQTPYLVFGDRTLKLFKQVSKKPSKPFFKFVTNSYASNDNILAHVLGAKDRHLLGKLRNIKIFEFLKFPSFRIKNEPKTAAVCDHSKTIIIDSRITYIGSSNFDPRSNNLNSEIGVLVEDESFADEVRRDINISLTEGNYFIDSEVLDGVDKLSFNDHLKNLLFRFSIEANLPSLGRIIFYPFQFILPRYLKRFF